MSCPSCTGPLTPVVIDSSGHTVDDCRACGARWSYHVWSHLGGEDRPAGTAGLRRAAAADRATSGDWYEWKLGRRSFANEFRYRMA